MVGQSKINFDLQVDFVPFNVSLKFSQIFLISICNKKSHVSMLIVYYWKVVHMIMNINFITIINDIYVLTYKLFIQENALSFSWFVLILRIIKTRVLYTGEGQVSTSFKADSRRNLVSAVAKLYPSPDWNVGIDRINLFDGNCTWRRTVVKDLYPWDAGNEARRL